MALLMSRDFDILVPYQYKVTDRFTFKIQMSSPLLPIRTAIGCVSLVSHVHITCLRHDKGKTGSASKRMVMYVFSCTILAVTWQWISEMLQTGQNVCSYVSIRMRSCSKKTKLWFLSSISDISHSSMNHAPGKKLTLCWPGVTLSSRMCFIL